MKWINPNFLKRETTKDGRQFVDVFLADDPDDCFLGGRIIGRDTDGSCIAFHFPETCSSIATALMADGSRIEFVHAFDGLPYDEAVATFERLGRTYILGRSWDGHFYIHCKLSHEYGLLAAV